MKKLFLATLFVAGLLNAQTKRNTLVVEASYNTGYKDKDWLYNKSISNGEVTLSYERSSLAGNKYVAFVTLSSEKVSQLGVKYKYVFMKPSNIRPYLSVGLGVGGYTYKGYNTSKKNFTTETEEGAFSTIGAGVEYDLNDNIILKSGVDGKFINSGSSYSIVAGIGYKF